MKITIVHLDLGIGGAEQLIVSIACALLKLGHQVTILTSHHDIKHCFEETKPDGVLGNCIEVYGDWLPRHICGKGTALFAILRMFFLALMLVLFHKSSSDVVFIDGVSAPIPFLRLFGLKVLFYCHFPDKLLCVERGSILKRQYRVVLDALEEWTTGCSNLILVNSKFTASMFKSAFGSLGRRVVPQVLYPIVAEVADSEVESICEQSDSLIPYCKGYDHVFVSLNRYERKKNISLALDAAEYLKQKLQREERQQVGSSSGNGPEKVRILLVVAGGYDVRVSENVEYLEELISHCSSRGMTYRYIQSTSSESSSGSGSSSGDTETLSRHVVSDPGWEGVTLDIVFRTSISSSERSALLIRAIGLLYTPDKEHFGIVPLEAMYLRTPVIAVNSGGPTETVLHGRTGFLCDQTAEDFGEAMHKLYKSAATPDSATTATTSPNKAKKGKQDRKQGGSDDDVVRTDDNAAASGPGGGLSMGEAARAHVIALFTATAMETQLQTYLLQTVSN